MFLLKNGATFAHFCTENIPSTFEGGGGGGVAGVNSRGPGHKKGSQKVLLMQKE